MHTLPITGKLTGIFSNQNINTNDRYENKTERIGNYVRPKNEFNYEEKRYNLFEPNRTDSNIRYYDINSLQKILNISLLNNNGLKISKIAALSQKGIEQQIKELIFKDGFENPNWNTTPLFMAMKEAIDNGMFVPDYNPNFDSPEDFYQNEDLAYLAFKEYMYLLNFNMWEMSEFWEGESLAPEWHDSMRTPQGIQTNNPKGYELHNTYIKPVLSKPDFTTIRAIFQDNDQGDSGYVAD